MAGPVEEKPFEFAVRAENTGYRQWMLRYADGGASVLHLTGDADRVEEIVHLINASVAARVEEAASLRPAPPTTGNAVKPPKADFAAMTAWDHYAIAAFPEARKLSDPHLSLTMIADCCAAFADQMMVRRAKAVRS